MGKETALPKNIRQIGDIRGREKICMEDYVMTYIRKKEPEEEKGYLGIFLGEKKQVEDSEYIFIRGILEVPVNTQLAKKCMQEEPQKNEKQGKKKEQQSKEKQGAEKERQNKEKQGEKQAEEEWQSKEKQVEEQAEENKKKQNETENEMQSARVEKQEETLAERIQKERRFYFPDWEIQGCCIIGTYPAERMEELIHALPETADLLYHLQEQEENFYRMVQGQYQRMRGYLVFYEQNKLMQEYMAEVFGDKSVEKESQPDRAIRNFREKIAQKSEQKSRSMLKLAGSFFVVTVLVIGAVVVNRMEEIQKINDFTELEREMNTYTAQELMVNAQPDKSIQSVDTAADDILLGASAFWEEDYEDAVSQSNVGVGIEEAGETAAGGDSAEEVGAAAAGGDSAEEAGAAAAGGDSAEGAGAVAAEGDSAEGAGEAAAGGDSAEEAGAAAAGGDSAEEAGEAASVEAASMRQLSAAYVIKVGDTLAEICSRYYGSLDRLEEICEMNGIDDANRILPGQKIVLP